MDRTRRSLLKLISSIPVVYYATQSCSSFSSQGESTSLMAETSSFKLDDALGQGILKPDIRAELDPIEMEELWLLFQQIGLHWRLAKPEPHWKDRFMLDINLKTSCEYAPSYYSEYRLAVHLFRSLRKTASVSRLGSTPALGAFQVLITPSRSSATQASGPYTCREHCRSFVIAEFCALYLAYGGFKGLIKAVNYRGYVGGPNGSRVPFRT